MLRSVWIGLIAFTSSLALAEPSVVLFGEKVTKLEVGPSDSGELLVPVASLPDTTGFEHKAIGMCSSNRCVPVPKEANWTVERDGETFVNVSQFARHLNMPIVHDVARGVWAVGIAPDDRSAAIELGQAPDFALPDRSGKIVRLSDFRGKKVLILTWASWCLCRQDLPGWQKVYAELRDKGFEIIAVAQDTAGEAAAGRYYDDAAATFTTLLDADHTVSALYQMVNVPMGIWIDEHGNVVRPAEVAYTPGFRVLGSQAGDDRYVPALRDWVENGAASEFVLTPESIQARMARRSPDQHLAELEFRVGAYLFAVGDKSGAREHWQAAQRLDPDNWNYHRQDWSFDPKEATANWFKKVRQLGDRPYYEPIDFSK